MHLHARRRALTRRRRNPDRGWPDGRLRRAARAARAGTRAEAAWGGIGGFARNKATLETMEVPRQDTTRRVELAPVLTGTPQLGGHTACVVQTKPERSRPAERVFHAGVPQMIVIVAAQDVEQSSEVEKSGLAVSDSFGQAPQFQGAPHKILLRRNQRG